MKIAIFTCITNTYDNLPTVSFTENDVDYICFTDNIEFFQQQDKLRLWEFKEISCSESGTVCNRAVKILPHLFLDGQYSHTVYIDGNIDVVGPVSELVARYKDSSIAVYEHPFRDNLKDEFIVCALGGRASIADLRLEYKNALKWGYQEDNTFYECSVIVRQHQKSDVIDQSVIWWNLFYSGIKRDQLYFKSSISISGISLSNIGESDPRFKHIYFYHRIMHTNRLRIKQRVLGWKNRILAHFYPELFEMDHDHNVMLERSLSSLGFKVR